MANLIEYIQSQVYENSTEDISGSIMQQVLTRMASDEGVVNVHTISGQTPFADYNNAQAARDAVPAGFKKLGLIITYKLSSGWYIDEFIGSATSGWSTASNWKCLGPISVSQNASTGKTTITIGSQSYDVATQPVSVSQNIETGKTELLIGDSPALIVDNEPEADSDNLVKSGGVADICKRLGWFNVNSYNNTTESYSSVQDAMDAIPTQYRSIRLVFVAFINDEWRILQFWGGSVSAWNANAVINFIGPTLLRDAAVETSKIKDAAVNSAKLGTGSVTTSKISDSAITTEKFAGGCVTESKIAGEAISPRTLGIQLSGERDTLLNQLGLKYQSVSSEQGKAIDINGDIWEFASAYLSEPVSLNAGEKIVVIVQGGTYYSTIAKDNGDDTYTPLVIATGTGVQQYEYVATESMNIVASSIYGAPIIYFGLQGLTDIKGLKLITETSVRGKTFVNDENVWNGTYWTIKDNLVNKYNKFVKAEVLVSGATTIHCCVFDETDMSLLAVADIPTNSAGTVTIKAEDIAYDFNADKEVGIWFMTDTYPTITRQSGVTNGNQKSCSAIGGTISYNPAKNVNVKIYTQKVVDSKLSSAVTDLNQKVFPIISDLQDYINKNRDCFIPAGTYTINTALNIPANTHIHGIKGATILKLGSADTIFNLDANSKHITIDNLTFIGKTDVNYATGDALDYTAIKSRTGIGTDAGIVITGDAENVNISDCDFSQFGMTAIHFNNTQVPTDGKATKICGIDVTRSYAGMIFEGTTTYQNNSEYMSVINSHFETCKIGVLILAANNIIDACQFKHNRVGIAIVGTNVANDGHGIISNCMANHCINGSLVCIDIQYGYSITGCHLIDGGGSAPTYTGGGVKLSNSKGIHIVGGNIGTAINIDNEPNDGINLIQCVMFTSGYGGGIINGNPSRLALNGNRFLDGSDYSSINNTL